MISALTSAIRPLELRTLDYAGASTGHGAGAGFRDQVVSVLRADGLVVVRGFPVDRAELVHFGRQFGELAPMVEEGRTPSLQEPLDWVGTESSKKRTFGKVLGLHTAASTLAVTPNLHAMLMMHKGAETSDPTVDNGQTVLARVDDAVRKLHADLGPEQAEETLRLLTTTAISTEHQFDYAQRDEPVLYRGEDGSWQFRYWTYIVLLAQRAGLAGERLEALSAFDAALNSPEVKFEVVLGAGDLIILNNRRVAHGRRPFPTEVMGDNGEMEFTQRRVYKIHVSTEL
jgi:alpha-ketoglutarate-dependent taurine dioxygenase